MGSIVDVMTQGLPPIEDLRLQDEQNFEQIRKAFENETLIPDDLIRAYRLYQRAAQPHLKSKRGSIANAIMAGTCSMHLVQGALSLFRLHSGQMFRETRAAVEAAGIAYAIQNDEKKLEVFLADDGRPEQRKEARKTFRPDVIFPASEPRLQLLKGHYDLASQRSHNNVLSFVLHLSKSSDSTATSMHIQDIPHGRLQQDFPLLLFWLCQAHLSILCCVEAVFPSLPMKELDEFIRERRYVYDKLNRFNQVYKGRLAEIAMPQAKS